MQPLRRKYIYKRSDNFKVILNQFFYGGKKLVSDDVIEAIRNEIHDGTNILYLYGIPLTISILECILKRNELMVYKDSIYFIFFKLRACSHEPGTVNYPGVMIAPGQALPRVQMMICCPGAMLPRVNFIALGQVHRDLITTNLSEFL